MKILTFLYLVAKQMFKNNHQKHSSVAIQLYAVYCCDKTENMIDEVMCRLCLQHKHEN